MKLNPGIIAMETPSKPGVMDQHQIMARLRICLSVKKNAINTPNVKDLFKEKNTRSVHFGREVD